MTERLNYNINGINPTTSVTISETVGNMLITGGSLKATFNCNTIGNLYTTGGNIGINTTSPGYLLDVSGSIKTSSYLLQPNVPSFKVYGNASSNTYSSGTTITNVIITWNNGSYYNNTNGRFTAPVSGYYHIWMMGNGNSGWASIQKNGAQFTGQMILQVNTSIHDSDSDVYYLNANDYITYTVNAGTIGFDTNDSWGAILIA